jgi:hypothetical protein
MSVWPIICGQDCVLCTFINETCMWMWMNICVVRICLLWAFPITVTVSRSISSYFAWIYPFSIYRNLPVVIHFRHSLLPILTKQKFIRVKTVRGFSRQLHAVFILTTAYVQLYWLRVLNYFHRPLCCHLLRPPLASSAPATSPACLRPPQSPRRLWIRLPCPSSAFVGHVCHLSGPARC